MYDLFSNKLTEPVHDLIHDLESLLLLELLSFDKFLEVSILTKFRDDVETVFGTENILELDDIRMVESFEKVNFREDGILKVLVVGEGRQIYFLYRYFLLGFSFHAFVNLSIYTLPQTFRCLVRVVPYHFNNDLSHLFCRII